RLIGVAAVTAVVILLLSLSRVPREDAAKTGPAPKTLWGEPDLQGIWTNEYEIPLQRPARYANKEFFTDEERAELDNVRTGSINRADGPEDRTLGERCMGAILPDFGGIAGFFPQIVQSPGTVSFFYDTGQGQGWQRVIPVTGRAHLPSDLRQWWGDSRGHWEG